MEKLGEAVDSFSSGLLGVPPDQANFILSQLISIPLSFCFRLLLPARRVGETVRHVYSVLIGTIFMVACFRWQALNVLIPMILIYGLICHLRNSPNLGKAVLFASLVNLSLSHIYRQYTDYGSYKLDITGPLMIVTQKLSTLAYSLTDGQNTEPIPDDSLEKQKVKEVPSLLEYLSYVIGFLGFQTGPSFFYNDYRKFIRGESYVPFTFTKPNGETFTKYPSTLRVTCKNFVQTIISAVIIVKVCPLFPVERLAEEAFIKKSSFLFKLFFCYVSTTLYRFRYYMAWKLGETVCNASGFGFRGWRPDGTEDWTLVKNCSIEKLETATSLKVVFDNWNIQTALWLRHVVYTRIRDRGRGTNAVFLISAIWHGFYPGYYVTFSLGMLYVTLGRKIRRCIRPLFQTSDMGRAVYGVLTFLGTHLALSFGVSGQILLRISRVLRFYHSVYFYIIVLCIVIYTLPLDKMVKVAEKKIEKSAEKAAEDKKSE